MLMRNKLINDIVQHFIDSKQFMHRSHFEQITESICSTFQNERKVFTKYKFLFKGTLIIIYFRKLTFPSTEVIMQEGCITHTKIQQIG